MPDGFEFADPAVLQRTLQWPVASPRGLVVIVHPDAQSREHCGLLFVADVLRANGLATLTLTLHDAEAQQPALQPPGMVQVKRGLRSAFDWVGTQPRLNGLPLALLGIGNAVQGCIAAAARYRLAGLRALVLLDGRPHLAEHLLARLSQPTLMVVGACDARTLHQHRAALRQMTAPVHLEVLTMATRPRAAPGAHQAFAHAAMNWLEQTLCAQGTPRGVPPAAVATLPRRDRAADALR